MTNRLWETLYQLAPIEGDGELLARFVASRDQAAFESLLRRHGPMVLGMCRRLLRHEQDAEDAFQATFLLLAWKAGRLRSPATVGCWLYGTAYRLALKTREKAARRASCERQARPPAAAPDPLAKITVREAQAAVDEELARLPERYRAPLILCCLEGATRDEAAQRLSLSAGSLKSRLERGRRLLSRRLAGRGLTLPAALLALGLAEGSTHAALPEALVGVAIRAAQAIAAGGMGAATLPPRVAFLVGSANRAPAPTSWKVVTALLGLTVAGAGLTFYQIPAEKP